MPERHVGSSSQAARPVGATYTTFVALFVAWVCLTTLRDHFTTPWGDDWRFLDSLFGGTSWAWYFAPRSGHRMPVTLLLLDVDYHRFGGHMHLLVGAMVAEVSLTAVAFGSAWGWRRLLHPAFAFAVFALFWAAAYFDLPWGMNHGSTFTVCWLAVALAALAHDQRARAGGGHGSTSALVVAGFAAIVATLGFGTGVAVFPALLAVALLARLPMRVVAAYVAVGIVTASVYSIGLSEARGGASIPVVSPLPRMSEVVLSFVGGPFGTAVAALTGLDLENRWRLSVVAGAAGLAAGLTRVITLFRRGGGLSGAEVLGVGAMAYAAVDACLVALGRSAIWDVGINSRFTLPATLFWIGLVASTAATWARVVPATLLVVASLLMLPAYRDARAEQARIHEILDLTAALHLLDLHADAETRGTLVKKRPEQIYRVVDRLRQDRRAMFAEPRAGLDGTPLTSHFTVDTDADCSGSARLSALATSRGRTGVRLAGYAFDPAGAPESIVVTDPRGIIRGLGAFTPIMHARFAASEPPEPGVPYRGFIADWDMSTEYLVWAVRAGGRSACPIAVTPSDRPES